MFPESFVRSIDTAVQKAENYGVEGYSTACEDKKECANYVYRSFSDRLEFFEYNIKEKDVELCKIYVRLKKTFSSKTYLEVFKEFFKIFKYKDCYIYISMYAPYKIIGEKPLDEMIKDNVYIHGFYINLPVFGRAQDTLVGKILKCFA